MSKNEVYDVVVVGSGAAGAMAALRAVERGLSVLVVEKARKFGGTSATSGGVMWVPNHQLEPNEDSREQIEEYLDNLIDVPVQNDRLQQYLDSAPKMAHYLKSLGLPLFVGAWPDYHVDLPGARSDRSILCETFDGRELGDKFVLMREQYSRFKVFKRYAIDLAEFFAISTQAPGWIKVFLKMAWRYWTDLSTRLISKRDRRFTQGGALMGHLFKQVFDRGIEIRLETKLDELVVSDGKVSGVKVSNFGRQYDIEATHGVILCAGGFEWNQELRDKFLPVPGLISHSSTPEHENRGEALIAGINIGAATEHTDDAWWMPTMHLPMPKASNFEETHQTAFDVGRPNSVCVNRNGVRFVNEATGYDEFGRAMVADHQKTGANNPCWLIFDAAFRKKWTAGGLLPTIIMPDRMVPVDWWDHYIFKAESIEGLAAKTKIPLDALKKTVAEIAEYSKTGVDTEFGRGGNDYDRMFGDPALSPNPCLAPIETAPFYAVPINNGDLGSKGGLKADANARVVNTNGEPIPNLYAAGNNSGSPFGNRYPGAGGTIGPALTFGYVAIEDIAARAKNT